MKVEIQLKRIISKDYIDISGATNTLLEYTTVQIVMRYFVLQFFSMGHHKYKFALRYMILMLAEKNQFG